MVVLRWNRVFSRVHAIQGVRNMVVLCWNHVFSRVHATQGVSNMGLLGFSWGAKRNVESLFVSGIDSLTFWPPGASGRSWALPRPRRPHLRYPPRVGWNHVFLRVQATQGGI